MRFTIRMGVTLMVSLLCIKAGYGATADPRIGMNAAGVSYYKRTAWVYNDLFKMSGPWESAAALSDPYGNLAPGETAGKWIIQSSDSLPTGRYMVTWEGDGGWNMGGFASLNAADSDNAAHYRIYDIDPANNPGGNGIYMSVYANTDLRNFSIIPVDAANQPLYAGQTFNPTFIERLAPFGTIRMMDMMAANATRQETWADRPTPSDVTYVGSPPDGMPVEHLVELANAAHSNPWFTMPARADDDYVRQFATYVRDNLDPGLTAYVEYGNEVWAPGGVGREYIDQQAALSGNDWWIQWAVEVKRDFAVWSDVFAGEEDRLVRVAAGQSRNRWVSPRFFDAMYDGGVKQFDALAMGAYLAPDTSGYDATTTAQQIIDDLLTYLQQSMDDTDAEFYGEIQKAGYLQWNKQLADEHGVPLLAYEGGQHIVPGSTAVDWYDAYLQAQRDPAMGEVYRALLAAYLDQLGGDLFNAFLYVSSISEYGAWGALEYQDQPLGEAPKYEALLNYALIPEPGTAMGLGGTMLLLAVGRRR